MYKYFLYMLSISLFSTNMFANRAILHNSYEKKFRDFERNLVILLHNPNLNKEQLDNLSQIKNSCGNEFRKMVRNFDENLVFSKADILIEHCLLQSARVVAEYICEELNVDKEIQSKLTEEACANAQAVMREKKPGSMAYIIDGTLEADLRKKIEILKNKSL